MLGIISFTSEDRITKKKSIMEPLTTESTCIFAFILVAIGSAFLFLLCLICSNCILQEGKGEVIGNPLFNDNIAFLEANHNDERMKKIASSDKMMKFKNNGQTMDTQYHLYKGDTNNCSV